MRCQFYYPNDKPLPLCLLPFLKHQSFYINSSGDGYTRSSVLLNVWMTSHHYWIKEGQRRTAQFLAPRLCPTAASPRCSSQETMSRLSRPITHADEFTRWDQLACPTAIHPSCTCIFLLSVSHVSLITSVRTVYSLSPSLWRLKPDVERLLTEERSRLMCVSLLIDSLH